MSDVRILLLSVSTYKYTKISSSVTTEFKFTMKHFTCQPKHMRDLILQNSLQWCARAGLYQLIRAHFLNVQNLQAGC